MKPGDTILLKAKKANENGSCSGCHFHGTKCQNWQKLGCDTGIIYERVVDANSSHR